MKALFSKTVTIFEGVDGSGKTTIAKEYADYINARYVHFHNLPRITTSLNRLYAEAMLPAVLGYQDVVLDRCWLSERPYGIVMRNGEDRVGVAGQRMLERLAMRCGAVVVCADPGWGAVRGNYITRGKKVELVEDLTVLEEVYNLYLQIMTYLPCLDFAYNGSTSATIFNDIKNSRMPCHPLGVASAGNYAAKIILVGEKFAERHNNDLWYQWPFASFDDHGCSAWLTRLLHQNKIPENQLCWVNADQDLSFLEGNLEDTVIALGNTAHDVLTKLRCNHQFVMHPQAHKRFHASAPYNLISIIKEHL